MPGARPWPRRARAALPLAIVLGLACAAAPPAGARPSRYESVLAPADSLARLGRPERAAAYADSLLRLAQADGNRALEAVVASRRVLSWVGAGRFEEGAREARRVAELARAERDTLSWGRSLLAEGRAYLFRDRLTEAAPPYRRLLPLARAVRDPMLEGNARLGLAYLDLSAGHPAAAEAGYRRAITLLERTRDTRSEMAARVGLARVQRSRGHTAEARRSYERIVERCRATGDRANEADAWNNLGALEAGEGDPGKAAECFARALQLSRALGRGNAQEVSNLAILLVEAGRAGAAEDTLEAELARRARADRREAYPLRTQLAVVRGMLGRRAEGERMLREQWALRDSVSADLAGSAGSHLVSLVEADGRLAEAYALGLELERWAAGRLTAGTEVTRRLQLAGLERRTDRPAEALERLRSLREPLSGSAAASWRERLSTELEFSRVFGALGETDSAVAAARRAADLWEHTASGVRDAEWYEPFGNTGARIAVQLALVLLDPRRAGTPEGRARAAFDAVQRFKSRALDWRSRPGPGRSEPLVTAAGLQRRVLRAGEVFVDAYSSQRDTTVLFVVTRDTIRARRTGAFDGLESGVARPLGVLLSTDAASGTFRPAAARRLAVMVFGDELELLRRGRCVIASLSGVLNAVPLAALPADTLSPAPLSGTRTMVTVPSATWLARARRAPPAALEPARVVCVARTTDAEGRALDGVRDEARWLAGRYGGAGVTHGGERALADVLPWISRGGVLHLAAHARASTADAWGSALLLGRGDGEEAWLTARAISARRPSARLAVLASCRSTLDGGFGNESVVGLARAFLAAGVPTVVSTLWPVDDAATAGFTRRFYLALERGTTVAEALRRAQDETRRAPATAAPYFWAGFTVSGDPDTRVRPGRAP